MAIETVPRRADEIEEVMAVKEPETPPQTTEPIKEITEEITLRNPLIRYEDPNAGIAKYIVTDSESNKSYLIIGLVDLTDETSDKSEDEKNYNYRKFMHKVAKFRQIIDSDGSFNGSFTLTLRPKKMNTDAGKFPKTEALPKIEAILDIERDNSYSYSNTNDQG